MVHPFYVINVGWVEAQDLVVGDLLKLVTGEEVVVSDIQSEELETPEKVYNFEVADWHTYYVSELGVLVHNKGSNSCGEFGDELVEGMGEAGFKTQDLLDEHYDKHVIKQGEFGNITKNEYLEGAQKLVTSSPGGDILTKTRTNGDTIFYNKATNEFAVTNKSGSIKTHFKPTDGINYFNGQN